MFFIIPSVDIYMRLLVLLYTMPPRVMVCGRDNSTLETCILAIGISEVMKHLVYSH